MRLRFKPGDDAWFIDKVRGEVVGVKIIGIRVNPQKETCVCGFYTDEGKAKSVDQNDLFKHFTMAQTELKKIQQEDEEFEKHINVDGGKK